MAAENETTSFFAKITEAVKAFIGKFTGGAQAPSAEGKPGFLKDANDLVAERHGKSGQTQQQAQAQARLAEASEKLGHMGEKITERANALKGQLPEGVQTKLSSLKGKAGDIVGNITKDMDPAKVEKMKQGGLMAGGAAATVDGVRRIAKKDADGKRHVVKGTLEAGAGVGMFTAAVLARRNGASNDGPQR